MSIELLLLREEYITQFKRDMREAFQLGAEAYFGDDYGQALPEKDIDQSLYKDNAIAYQAMQDGELVGGAIISTEADTRRGDLEFLYVRAGFKAKAWEKPFGSSSKMRIPKLIHGKQSHLISIGVTSTSTSTLAAFMRWNSSGIWTSLWQKTKVVLMAVRECFVSRRRRGSL